MTAGELYNLRRASFALPQLPETPPTVYFQSQSRQAEIAFLIQSDDAMTRALQTAIINTATYRNPHNAAKLARAALVLATGGIGFRDSVLLSQSWALLLALPKPPASGGFARNDASGAWGDLLEGSEALADAAMAFTLLRNSRPESEQHVIVQTLTLAAIRLRNGIEFIGPNNHALSTGANLASALLLLPPTDFPGGKRTRIELWRIAERYLQIGLAQIGPDGVYREGPGYAQTVLRHLTRLSNLLYMSMGENLLKHPLLHKLAVTTAELSRNNGSPLPLDDTFPISGNLWRQVARLLPQEPLIAQFATLSPSGTASVEGLFDAAWFAPRATQHRPGQSTCARIYRDGGAAIIRNKTDVPIVTVLSGEPRNRWTGRHEQIDPGNLLCEVGSQMRITSGGYGPQGVYDADRRYWMSSEAQSAFLVDGEPLHEFYDSDDNENSPVWDGALWDQTNLIAKTTWKQDGVWLSRTMLSLGNTIAIIDRIDSTDQEFANPYKVEIQFMLSGEVLSPEVGEWSITAQNGENPLRMVTLPAAIGTLRKGFATLGSNSSEETTQLRLPLERLRVTLLFPGSAAKIPIAKSRFTDIEKVQWRDAENREWLLNHRHRLSSIDGDNNTFASVTIKGTLNDRELLYHCIEHQENNRKMMEGLQLSDAFGSARYSKDPTIFDTSKECKNPVREFPISYRGVPIDTIPVSRVQRSLHGWYVFGSPRYHLQEATIPTPPSQLSTLYTSNSSETIAEQIATWEPNRRAALEAEIADSILSGSAQGLDSLGLRKSAALAMAAIDATTDGFAPGVFRVPFDADESWQNNDNEKNRLRLRGKWGSGLSVEKFAWEHTDIYGGWSVERSAPHHQTERYQTEYWYRNYLWTLDHSDGYSSGLGFAQSYHYSTFDHRLTRDNSDRYTFQSLGVGEFGIYQVTTAPTVRSVTFWNSAKPFVGGIWVSGTFFQTNPTNTKWRSRGQGMFEWGSVLKGMNLRASFDNRYGKWNQFEGDWISSSFQSIQFVCTQTAHTSGLVDGNVWGKPIWVYSDSSNSQARERARIITRAEEQRGAWVAFAKLPLLLWRTQHRNATIAAYTERERKRVTGLEWREIILPFTFTLRSAASTTRLEQGAVLLGYWSPRFAIEGTGEYASDEWSTGFTTSLPTTIPLGEFRFAITRTETTSPITEILTTGSIEWNRFDQGNTSLQQRIDYTISSTGDKTAEGGISLRW